MIKIEAIYAMLKKMNEREKGILYVALLIVSIMMLDRVIIGPIFAKIKFLNEEIETKESSVRRGLKVLAYKDKILSESNKYSAFLDGFGSAEEEITSILQEVETLASKTSIYVIDMKPRGLSQEGATAKYNIRLSGEAQMQQIIDFMFNIENSESLLTIERYEITPKTKESSVARCSMSISKLVMPAQNGADN